MKNDINIILSSIIEESEIFLENDMGLDLTGTKEIDEIILTNHFSLVDLTCDEKYTVVVSMEDNLFEALFNKFFEDGVSEDEKDELIEALPAEIANTVTGLAIKHFPLKIDKLELSVPFSLEKDEIVKMTNQKISKSMKINTKDGSFICIVSKIK